jgi:nitrogen fixation/metabolism regulation signal transduction histidine kinase
MVEPVVSADREGCVVFANNLIRLRATVNREFPEEPTWVVDDGRVAQEFLNLIVNAAQAIPEGAIDRNEIAPTRAPSVAPIETVPIRDGIVPRMR